MVTESITNSSAEKPTHNVSTALDDATHTASTNPILPLSESIEPRSLEIRQQDAQYPYGRRERTDGVTLLSFYHFAWGVLYLLGGLITAVPAAITGIIGLADDPGAFIATAILGFALFFILGLSLLNFAIGFGLWHLKHWGRTAALALALISLPTGMGTIPGALTLWYLLKEDISRLFK